MLWKEVNAKHILGQKLKKTFFKGLSVSLVIVFNTSIN